VTVRVEARVFIGVTVFFFVIGVTYWFTSYEDAGAVMLLACAGLGIVTGGYLAFQAHRIAPRPEDRADARISDGAGPIGDFPSASIWPVALAFGATTLAAGLVFGLAVVLIGGALFVTAGAGLIRESRDRARRR